MMGLWYKNYAWLRATKKCIGADSNGYWHEGRVLRGYSAKELSNSLLFNSLRRWLMARGSKINQMASISKQPMPRCHPPRPTFHLVAKEGISLLLLNLAIKKSIYIVKAWISGFFLSFFVWVCLFESSLNPSLFECTVNVTGVTLVLNKTFPDIKQTFAQH